MSVIEYKSTDASAPSITGQNGSLEAFLEALLVGTAGFAYGAKASLGWTKVSGSTGTIAGFRNGTTYGTGYYVQIYDDGSGTGGAKEAALRGFEAMSGHTTGTAPFPSVAQLSTGVIIRKSSTANGTARAWWALGKPATEDGGGWLYFCIDSEGLGLDKGGMFFFGDMCDIEGANPVFGISGSETANQSTSNTRCGLGRGVAITTAPSTEGIWISRNYANIAGGVRAACTNTRYGDAVWGGAGTGVSGYPAAVNNAQVLDRGYIHEGVRLERAYFPNLYVLLHGNPLTDLTYQSSVPGLPASTNTVSKQWYALAVNTAQHSNCIFDLTN